jgi:hypothetical protein
MIRETVMFYRQNGHINGHRLSAKRWTRFSPHLYQMISETVISYHPNGHRHRPNTRLTPSCPIGQTVIDDLNDLSIPFWEG